MSAQVREKLLERRTFTDVTVNPAFAHAPDYTLWLVLASPTAIGPDVWTVRFASVDDDRDTVVLVDAPPMNDLHSGQLGTGGGASSSTLFVARGPPGLSRHRHPRAEHGKKTNRERTEPDRRELRPTGTNLGTSVPGIFVERAVV